MGVPGQEGGNGVTDVLYGGPSYYLRIMTSKSHYFTDVNPSGRLPFTFAKSQSDYSAAVVTTGSSSIVQM